MLLPPATKDLHTFIFQTHFWGLVVHRSILKPGVEAPLGPLFACFWCRQTRHNPTSVNFGKSCACALALRGESGGACWVSARLDGQIHAMHLALHQSGVYFCLTHLLFSCVRSSSSSSSGRWPSTNLAQPRAFSRTCTFRFPHLLGRKVLYHGYPCRFIPSNLSWNLIWPSPPIRIGRARTR